MDSFLQKIFDQLQGFFTELSMVRKFGLLGILLLVIIIMILTVKWAGSTRYKVLFTELNKEDLTMIARMLEEKNISYLIDEDGKTLKVPEDQVEIWRLELAKQGMSFTGTVGYEVFDKQAFGTTSFVQKVNRQRALEGELIKTIKYLKGVKRVRVHLSIPEESPFVADKKAPSASIVLELDGGVILTSNEVRGITHLVAASVEGMRPENVVVIDERGKRLSENMGDPITADTANRMLLEGQLGRNYEKQIEDILGKVVGEGRVVAKVTVKMDFSESVSTETSYDSENTAVVSEVSNTQKLQGARPSPQGVPGARSNIPGEEPAPTVAETKNDVDKKIYTRNYNVPSKIIKTRRPTATIKTITAAVMLDGKQIPALDAKGQPLVNEDGIAQKKTIPWTQEELASFKEIVSSTVGLATKRGDQLVIRNMEFVKEDLTESENLLRKRENRVIISNIIKYLAVGIIMTLFFVIVVRPFIQWITENTVESVEDFLPRTIQELEKIQSEQKLPGLEEVLPQIEERINPEKIEGNMLKEKIISLVEENPGKAAQIIHSMLHHSDSEKQIA